MNRAKFLGLAALLCAGLGASGCTSIRENRGYIIDPLLTASIQPGIDNRASVEGTLGRPTFMSQFGEPTWYYVSSTSGRRPFSDPRITNQNVLAIKFDAAGKVVAADRSGLEKVVYLSPDGDKTPTLGRERTFLEDLFGNIGAVGSAAAPGGSGQ